MAVVTGAALGIGRELSVQLAGEGCRLALVDVNETGLAETAGRINQSGGQTSIHVADVSNAVRMERISEEITQRHGAVHLLINNAGVSLAGPFETSSLADWEWIVGVNFWGVVHACKFFLPALRREPEAHLVNVASDFALIGCPTKSAYCATKFAVRGFTEALRTELLDTNVKVTCVYPGPVNTGLVQRGRAWDAEKRNLEAHFLAQRGIAADKAAARIVAGIQRNAARVLIGKESRLADLAARCFPVWSNTLIGRLRNRFPFL